MIWYLIAVVLIVACFYVAYSFRYLSYVPPKYVIKEEICPHCGVESTSMYASIVGSKGNYYYTLISSAHKCNQVL